MENIAINKINIAKMSSELEIQNLKYSTLYQKSLLQKEGYEFDINEDKTAIPILDKITKQSIKLGDLAVIKETVHTGNVRDKILVTTRINPFCNKILRGKDCQRYYFVWQNFWINTDDTVIDKNKGEYATIPNKSYFEKPKLFLREIAERLTVCYDEERYYSLNKAYVLSIKDNKISIKLLLGLLNSSLLSWFFRIRFESAHVRGGHLQFKKQYTSQIPIKIPASVQEKKIISLVNQMLELQKKYHNEKIIGNEKERLKSQIDAVDYEIDQEVYKLYELTPEEINIVEESLK
jgi:adenine-specific DNA-methyltransferase